MDTTVQQEQKEALKTVPAVGNNAKWYVIHIQTGYENKVKRALEQRIKSLSVEESIFDIVIPMRDIIVIKKGKSARNKKNNKESCSNLNIIGSERSLRENKGESDTDNKDY